MPIHFHSQNISFTLKNKKSACRSKASASAGRELKVWLSKTVSSEKKSLGNLNFVFCSDNYLLQLNQTYLQHNTYTDIITFDYSDKKISPSIISGDIFISIERVKENAEKFQVPFLKELHRVMIHGVLHLMGYKDKTKKDKMLMREKEDFYLAWNWKEN